MALLDLCIYSSIRNTPPPKPDLLVIPENDYILPGDAPNAVEQEQSCTDSTSVIVLPFISVSVTEVTMCHVKQLTVNIVWFKLRGMLVEETNIGEQLLREVSCNHQTSPIPKE